MRWLITVPFALAADQLRRLPGARRVENYVAVVVMALLAVALVALGVWMAQRSPQRVSMAELVAGNLAPMQNWIIVSGDLASLQVEGYRYELTDADVADASITVSSDVPLAVGPSTVSGTLIGGHSAAQPGFAWLGQLNADTVLAREPDPPWLAMGVAAVALFLGLASLSSYPVFLAGSPHVPAARSMTMPVSIRRGWPPASAGEVPGLLTIEPGAAVELRAEDGESLALRLHSAHSSIDAGELRWLSRSEPVLVVRRAAGDLTLSFDSLDDRDAAFGALLSAIGHAPRQR